MSSENWLYLIIGLVVFNYLFSTVLNYLNDKNWKTDIPENMKEFYDEEKYIKAKNYSKEKGKISLISSTLSLWLPSVFYGLSAIDGSMILLFPITIFHFCDQGFSFSLYFLSAILSAFLLVVTTPL